ncbi:MAG: tetratricopeptide repeat protein [Chloroflexota bacterium]|nr:tetratricopeptide repeat protein [Chloroflexota bacterium]
MTVEEMERRFYELKGKLDVGTIAEAEFKTEIEKLKFQDHHGRLWMIGAQSGKWYTFDGARWLPGQPPAEPPPPPAPAPIEQPTAAQETLPAPIEQSTAAQEISPAPIEQLTAAQEISPAPASLETAAPVGASEPTPATSQETETPRPAPQPLFTPPPIVPPPPVEWAPAPVTFMPPPLPEHLPPAPQVPVAPPSPEHVRRGRALLALPRPPISGPVVIIGAAVLAMCAVLVFWVALDNLVPGKPISSFLGGLTGTKSTATALLTPTPSVGTATTPKEIAALITVGDQLLLQSNIDAAIAQYQSAAQLAPASPIPLTRWSRALGFKGQMQDALDKAQQAVQRGPSDADANAQLCRALAWNGQGNDAIAAGEKAIQLDPKNANAHAFLAEAYLLARRVPDAQNQAQTALQLAPQSAEAYRAQAWVLTIQGQKNTAVDTWRQTVSLEPDFYFRHFELAEALRVYFTSAADAIPEYRKSISLYGGYVPAISRLGMALIDTGQAQDAEAPLQRAITLDPQNVDGYAYLGIAFGKQNQCAQAIPYFEQALKIDPNNSLAQRGLADCKGGKVPSAPAVTPLPVPLVPPTLAPGQ